MNKFPLDPGQKCPWGGHCLLYALWPQKLWTLQHLTEENVSATVKASFRLFVTVALHDYMFPFLQIGSIPWSTGQSFSQSPWDFMKKKKVEQVTVLLSGDAKLV